MGCLALFCWASSSFPNVLRMAVCKRDIPQHNALNILLLRFMLTPTFRDHSSLRLAGLRRFHTFADGPREIPTQWAEFNQLPIPGLHATKIFCGVTCQTDLPNQRFEYMCAFEISDLSIASPNGRMLVPAARYAVFTDPKRPRHPPQHTAVHLEAVATRLRRQNRPHSRLRAPRRALQPTTLEGPVEIWFPVQREP